MAKLKISLSEVSESSMRVQDIPEEEKSYLALTFKKPGGNNPGEKLRELFTTAKSVCASGSGVTITFEFNSGKKSSVYIDGDGSDRILEVK